MQESTVDWIKKGKVVQIKDWKSMEDEFGVDRDGDIDCPISFTRQMLPLCGRTITITSEMQRSYNSHGYFLVYDENAQSWMMTDDMIEPVED